MSRHSFFVALSVPAVALVACSPEPTDPALDAGVDAPVAPIDASNDASIDDASTAPDACDVAITAPPSGLSLDAFYVKYLDAAGIPVVSSAVASDDALRAVCRIVRVMVGARDDVRLQMIAHHARLAVMARTEVTTDVPEHADLYAAYPGTDWDTRARGLGATVERPATSCAEENVLCDATDPYVGENILVHEFAHGMVNLGVVFADPTFLGRLNAALSDARANGRWVDTYAATNADEYFAEGVQSYFDTNVEATPPNGIHNEVDTRGELEAYDPALFGLVAEVFPGLVWSPTCP